MKCPFTWYALTRSRSRMDSWMLWLDGALEGARARGAALVLAATYISLRSVPVTPESGMMEGGERGCGNG